MLSALRDDALTSAPDGFALRVSLPWIRSLPLSCVQDLAVALDGTDVPDIRVLLDARPVDPAALAGEDGWWFVQDRLVVSGDVPVDGGHRVDVSFRLLVPYLPGGPDRPLVLPFRFKRELDADAAAEPWAGRDVA